MTGEISAAEYRALVARGMSEAAFHAHLPRPCGLRELLQ